MDFPGLEELQAAIAATSKAINEIVDLVPSQYWFVEDHEQMLESRFHKHKKRALEPTTKVGTAKKAKLDLDNTQSVTARQLAMAQETKAGKVGKMTATASAESGSDSADDDDEDDEDEDDHEDDDSDDDDNAMSVDEDEGSDVGDSDNESGDEGAFLSEHPMTVSERRTALEKARQTKNPRKLAKKAAKQKLTPEEKRAKRTESKKKAKKQRQIDQIKKESSDGQILDATKNRSDAAPSANSGKRAAAKSADSVNEAISFGNVDFGEEKRKKKGPANKDVKAQLAKAERERERLAELEELNPEKAATVKEKAAWRKAMLQAAGEKIKDDAALLKKAVKRKEKEKMKRKEAWKDRTQSLAKDMKERVKKRAENIQKKIDERKSKKGGKKGGSGKPKSGGGKPKGGKPKGGKSKGKK